MVLAFSGIVGVPVGGFGVPFASLSDREAQAFKVWADRHPTSLVRLQRGHRSCSWRNCGI